MSTITFESQRGCRMAGEHYLVHETSTNNFAVGPFDREIQARAYANVEMDRVECVIVTKPEVPQRLLRRVINPFTLIPKAD